MVLLSEEAEEQLIAQVTEANVKSMEKLLKINSLPDVLKKSEVVSLLRVCNNTADKYLIAYLPFIRIGSDKRWIKSEVLRVLKERQEYL